MSGISKHERKYLLDELHGRFSVLTQTLEGRTPTSPTDGAGRGRWIDHDKIILLSSTQTERKVAVDDFQAILRRIAAIK